MGKVALVPLKILRRIVELDKDEDDEIIVGIHLPSERFLVDDDTAQQYKAPGKSFFLFDKK